MHRGVGNREADDDGMETEMYMIYTLRCVWRALSLATSIVGRYNTEDGWRISPRTAWSVGYGLCLENRRFWYEHGDK